MPGKHARELCPELMFVGGHFKDYQRLGDAAIAVLGDFTPLVERISIDEAFADVSGTAHLFGPPPDIAKAIRWAHDHANDYGGDPKSIFVMGHSAGAHLAALVCTDDRYLKAEGLSLSIIKGCVPVDVSVYDIPKRLEENGTTPPATFKEVFGESGDIRPAAAKAANALGPWTGQPPDEAAQCLPDQLCL